MRTIGLIGGLDWRISQQYYQTINTFTQRHLGGSHSAQCVLVSIDFGDFEKRQNTNGNDDAVSLLVEAAQNAERAGADIIVLCASAAHHHAAAIEAGCNIPILHIADAVGQELVACGIERVALLGTRYVMQHSGFGTRMADAHGIEVLIPNTDDCNFIDKLVYAHHSKPDKREPPSLRFKKIVDGLVADGVESIVLGCPEVVPLLPKAENNVPYYDAQEMHAIRAVDWALAE